MKLGTLVDDPENPRYIDDDELEDLIRSIQEYGLVEHFVGRKEDRRIIGGHQRAKAIFTWLTRDKGWTEKRAKEQDVTVVFIPNLSESKCRALNLALNKIKGDWSYARVVGYIAKIASEDLPLTGFSQDELDDLAQLTAAPPPGPDVDPDSYLSNMKLAFAFKVANQEEAELCKQVLTQFGMTGPKDAAPAFVRAMKAAQKKKK